MREIYRSLHPFWQLIIITMAAFCGAFIALGPLIGTLMLLNLPWICIFQSYLLSTEDAHEILIVKVAQITYAFGFFAFPYFLHRKITGEPQYSLRWSRVNWKYAIFLGLMVALSFPFINLMAEWNSHLILPEMFKSIQNWIEDKEQMASHLIELFIVMKTPQEIIINIILIALMPAIVEELFFRGTIQPILLKLFRNVHLAVWVTGFLFAFLHLQFFGFLPRMILGVLFGYVAHWSGSLWVPMVGHLANNLLALLVSLLIQKGLITPNVEMLGSNSSEWLFSTLAAIILVAGTLFLRSVYNKKASEFQRLN